MPWKTLKSFSISGTNLPIETVLDLGDESLEKQRDSLRQLNKRIESRRSKLLQEILLVLKKGKSPTTPAHRKLKKRVASDRLMAEDLAQASLDAFTPENRKMFHEHLTDLTSLSRLQAEMAEQFEQRFELSRQRLWEIAKDHDFQRFVLTLNPSFYDAYTRVLQNGFPQKRNASVRKKELTLAAYLYRFCAKNSVAGHMGPIWQGQFSSQLQSGLKEVQWKKRHEKGIEATETFLSFWAASAISDTLLSVRHLLPYLQWRLHPAVEIRDGGLVSLVPGEKDGFFPTLANFDLPSDSAKLLKSHFKSSRFLCFQDWKPEEQKLMLDFLPELARHRFFLSSLSLSPGDEDLWTTIFQEIEEAQKRGFEDPILQTLLNELDEDLKAFAECDSEAFQGRFLSIEAGINKLFDHLQDEHSSTETTDLRRGAGQYYADRFVAFQEAKRAAEPLDVSHALGEKLRNDASLALELSILPWIGRCVLINERSEQLSQALGQALRKSESSQQAYGLLRLYAEKLGVAAQPGERVSGEGQAILRKLQALTQCRQQILASIPTQEAVFALEDMPLVDTYRQMFAEIAELVKGKVPLYASGSIFQLAVDPQSREAFWVFDSTIFGNAMHLSMMNRFVDDRFLQALETEEFLKRSLNIPQSEHLLRAIHLSSRKTKFASHLFGGHELEVSGLSAKERDQVLTFSDMVNAVVGADRRLKVQVDEQTLNLIPWTYPRTQTKLVFSEFEERFPRLLYRGQVIQRAQWKFKGADVSGSKSHHVSLSAYATDLLDIVESMDIPRFVFVDPSGPKKNIMVDFHAGLSVEAFRNLAVTNEVLRISEMLPDPTETGLKHFRQGSFVAGPMPTLYFET